MGRRVVSVSSFVDLLRSTEGAPITSERVAGLFDEITIDEATLRPYVTWADDHYTRNLVHRDAHFDLMLICWKPGQGTPIHTHNGQLGWASVVRGALDSTEYRWTGCDRPENQNVAGLDCLAGGRQVKLEPTQRVACTPGGDLNRVTKQVTIHSLIVPPDCREPVVSFHAYSLPFDSCVVFDVARGQCRRKDLAFDTVPPGYAAPVR